MSCGVMQRILGDYAIMMMMILTYTSSDGKEKSDLLLQPPTGITAHKASEQTHRCLKVMVLGW